MLTHRHRARLVHRSLRQTDRQAKKKSQTGLCDRGHSSDVILHSVSAYLVSLLLLQNLLICKSIAYIYIYIYSGAFTTYIFVLYLPQGRGCAGKMSCAVHRSHSWLLGSFVICFLLVSHAAWCSSHSHCPSHWVSVIMSVSVVAIAEMMNIKATVPSQEAFQTMNTWSSCYSFCDHNESTQYNY